MLFDQNKSLHDHACSFPSEPCTCQFTNMLNFYEGRYVHKYCNSFVAIGFRTDKINYDINKDNFILNSKYDGWFRKAEGIANGHGLCINSIKITNRNKHYHNGEPTWVGEHIGDFKCYKAEIQYTNNDFEPKEETDKFWVIVHKKFDIKDVLEYIEQNKENWYP